MYDTYRYIFIGGLVLSLVFLAATVFVFFFLNIKDAIGDITGSNKRRAMERAKEGKPQKTPKTASKPVATGGEASQMTSRMSIQDRYDAMEDSQHTTTLNLDKKNRVKKAAKTAQSAPIQARAPESKPTQTEKKQSQNFYKPIVISDPDFVLEADITYVHSSEVIV